MIPPPSGEIPRPPSSSGEFVVPHVPSPEPSPPPPEAVKPSASAAWFDAALPPPPAPPGAPPGAAGGEGVFGGGAAAGQQGEAQNRSVLLTVEPKPAAPAPERGGPSPTATGANRSVPSLAPMHEIQKPRRQLLYALAGVGAIVIGVVAAILVINASGGADSGTAHASVEEPVSVGVRFSDPLVLPMGNAPEEESPDPQEPPASEPEEDDTSSNGRSGKRTVASGTHEKGEQLTAAERRMLEKAREMGSDSSSINDRKNSNHEGSGSASHGQPLSSDAIRSTISQNRTSIQRCYEREMRGSAASGDLRVVLRITVQPSGVVSSSRVTTSRVSGTALASCMESASRRWRFPSATASSTFDAPFVLTPGTGR